MRIIILFFVFSSFNSLAQGSWVKGKDKAYFQLGGSRFYHNQSVINRNRKKAGNNYCNLTTQLHSEYDLKNKLDAHIIIPRKFLGFKNSSLIKKSLTAFSNIVTLLKYLIYNKKVKMNIGFSAESNAISKEKEIGLCSGFDASTIFPHVAIVNSKNRFYYFLNLGYGYVINNYNDYIKYYVPVTRSINLNIYKNV